MPRVQVGSRYTARLRQHGITSIRQFSEMAASPAGRAALFSLCKGDDPHNPFNDKKLQARRWAHGLLRIVTSLDKAAALKALHGKRGDDLTALGLSSVPGDETFVLERVKQSGTIADAG